MLMVMNMDARKTSKSKLLKVFSLFFFFFLTDKPVILTLFYSQPVIFLAKWHFSVQDGVQGFVKTA